LIAPEVLPVPPKGWWGGAESLVWDLALALSKMGHSVTLIARPGSSAPPNGRLIETFPDVPDALGVNERHFNCYRSFVKHFDGVVHDHSLGKLARTIHSKVLQTPHFAQHPSSMGFKNIAAISHAQASWLNQFTSIKIPVVHHGIDASRFKFSDRKEDFYLFFSVVAEYKGAFEALKIAREANVKMVFAGRNGDCTDLIKNSGIDNAIYLGEVSNEERADLMSRAKALVFPTGAFGRIPWLECFGLVQLESLASGTPVIASSNGACPEVIKNYYNGFICSSYQEMLDVVKKDLVSSIDPANCRKCVDEYFSADRMARDYLALYQKILRRGRID
jgi:glycosyltransferase involved in cell wall biosynthesis